MTSRERVIAALTFQGPDRVPVDLWPIPASFKQHGEALVSLLREHPIDFLHPFWLSKWDPEAVDPGFLVGVHTDKWGVTWKTTTEGWYGMDVVHPIDDWAKLKDYQWPVATLAETSWDDSFKDPNRFSLAVGSYFFHQMCWLRGMEELMVDIMDDRSEVYELRDKLLDHYSGRVGLLANSNVDGVIFFDDWGSQNQLLVSPKVWRSFMKPVYKELLGICKNAGKYVFFHSDGYIMEIIDDLIELGVDALNCQVWCMDPKVLGGRYRGSVAFWGEIDRQYVIPRGSPDDIREQMRQMREHLATPKGGLIGQSEVDSLTPLKNIETLLSAWNEQESYREVSV